MAADAGPDTIGPQPAPSIHRQELSDRNSSGSVAVPGVSVDQCQWVMRWSPRGEPLPSVEIRRRIPALRLSGGIFKPARGASAAGITKNATGGVLHRAGGWVQDSPETPGISEKPFLQPGLYLAPPSLVHGCIRPRSTRRCRRGCEDRLPRSCRSVASSAA
jgi:hypothetical protein